MTKLKIEPEKEDFKIASPSESEMLQKEGWIVVEVFIKDGKKVHKLVKK
ncbi:MAG: hypothetical protein NUV80_05725 [Candidatus Berkelbacteria bacterium]|nr:hypothetical protein [Candidatus Berkelbacteria bacterium]